MKLVAQFFGVLAEESRLKILWLLFNHRELCVCDVMAVVGITQSNASRHLAALRNAGLVADRKEGLWSYYSLCQLDDELANEQIELLRRRLARGPDAPQLVGRLHTWLEAQTHGVACSKEAATDFMTKTTGNARRGRGSRRNAPKARR